MYDAIVVGGGIVGASAAYHLAREGADVLLADRSDPGRATGAGAGIVSPATGGYESGPFYRFAIEAARYYPDLVSDLDALGLDAGYDRPGLLVVAADEDERDDYDAAKERIFARQEESGYPPEGALYEVSAERAVELFPPIEEPFAALYYEGGGRVEGQLMNRALVHAGEEHGLEAVPASVEGIASEDGSVEGVVAGDEEYRAPSVVVAGGAWSGAFADDLGVEVPVTPQRGQIAHFDLRGRDTRGWPIVSPFREHYLVPWEDGRVAAGATRESDAGFSPYPTAAGVREVLSEALRVAPGLADAELQEIRVGLRPLSADGLPVVGEADPDGAYLATGHGPLGLTLGPYTGKVVADLILENDVESDLAAFSPERF